MRHAGATGVAIENIENKTCAVIASVRLKATYRKAHIKYRFCLLPTSCSITI
jgi:hypothetical protein